MNDQHQNYYLLAKNWQAILPFQLDPFNNFFLVFLSSFFRPAFTLPRRLRLRRVLPIAFLPR